MRGFTLVSTLMTMAIICLLAVVLFKGSGIFGASAGSDRPDGKGKTIVGKSMYSAKDEVCRSNLSQLRQSLQILRINEDDQPPATLEDSRLGSSFYTCAVGGEPYTYDPSTGRVSCPHPGHEKY
jgi:hypothetical protein